jgi:hypothetical protein
MTNYLFSQKLISASFWLIGLISSIFRYIVMDGFLNKELPQRFETEQAARDEKMGYQGNNSIEQKNPLSHWSWSSRIIYSVTSFFKSAEFLFSWKFFREIHSLRIGKAPIIMMISLERRVSEVSLTRLCPVGSFYFTQS